MEHIPLHVLVTMLETLDTRSVVRASMTCRALYDAAEQVRSLQPVLRPHTVVDQLDWMAARRDRITRVRAVRLSPLSQCWAALADMPALTALAVALSRVPASILRTLSAPSLRALDIHRLAPGMNDVFSTRVLARFPNLRRAHITFAPGWALAVVGPGDVPAMDTLELRRIPAIAVTASLPVTTHVGLYALDVLSGRVPVAPRCSSLSLRCDETPIDTLPDLVHPDVRVLSLAVPRNLQDVDVASYTHLQALHLASTFVTVPDLRGLSHLTRLQLDAAKCLVFDRRSAVPQGLSVLSASSQHRPLDITPYLDMSAAERTHSAV